MAIQRRTNVPTNAGGLQFPPIAKPSDLAAGDMQFIFLGIDTVATTIIPPAGFATLVEQLNSAVGGGQAGGIYYKLAGASEPAEQVFTLGTSSGVAMGTWANYDDAGGVIEPYSPATADDALGPTLTSPSATTLNANDRVYSCYVQDQSVSAGSYAASLPGGAAVIVDAWHVTSTFTGSGVQEETRAAAGAGTHAVTQNTGGDNTRGCLTFIMAIKVAQFLPDYSTYPKHKMRTVAA